MDSLKQAINDLRVTIDDKGNPLSICPTKLIVHPSWINKDGSYKPELRKYLREHQILSKPLA